ncbi:hypothetical protein HOP62_07195 [Halomonas sp. MCCC 1A17488]|uniref:Uncharacterized protein n=2 Tax=Oceanospirillales TaxID=135619 RepID=A0ABX7W9J7_9GAMM|nr:hypothetical protein [Halomonas sp. MCCC 1A17488]MCG3239193.1 hypothetical protein [Halomonas sp. MCCC 1A17488]QPP51546.1 hypothetical protein I4484_07200 [Halomonas sp. SS10-MC5]QTP57003.1 hypothetical protein HNO51_06650 [Halomonas sulfidoxydans]
MTTTGLIALCLLGTSQAHAQDGRMTLGAVAGTTGAGADLAWRFSERLGVSARYTGGLDWNTDYRTDDVDYDGDVNLAASKLTLDYYPFASGFFLSAGLMLPDIDADVVGRPRNGSYAFNGRTYDAELLGTLHGKATLVDGVQPYAGLGWRQAHRSGFGVFAEIGVIPTDPDVSLRTSEGFEDMDNPLSAQLRQEIRQEEQRLEDEANEWPIYPVAVVGVSYTF